MQISRGVHSKESSSIMWPMTVFAVVKTFETGIGILKVVNDEQIFLAIPIHEVRNPSSAKAIGDFVIDERFCWLIVMAACKVPLDVIFNVSVSTGPEDK